MSQAVGGTIWHGIKGFRNSPYGERRIGALTAIKMRAPVLGGNFGTHRRLYLEGWRGHSLLTDHRCLGWPVQHFRLHSKGHPEEGGSIQRNQLVATTSDGFVGNQIFADKTLLVAGFFTGGALAIRGGYKAARNGAIGCAVLLAVIEGVGIGFQKMLAGSTKLEVSIPCS